LREHAAHFRRRRRTRRELELVEPQVEARTGVQALLRDVALLALAEVGRVGLAAAVLPLAVAAQIVELALHPAALVGIALVLDPAFEVLLALRLRLGRRVDVAAVVAEGAVAAATELELDVLLLDADGGDHHAIAGPQRDPEILDALRVRLVVDRR